MFCAQVEHHFFMKAKHVGNQVRRECLYSIVQFLCGRIKVAPLTEERRKELVKTVKKYTEEAKVQIRNARRDAIDKYKAMKKDGEITEDDLKETEKDIQDLTDKYIKEIDNISAAKEKEILEV